MTAHPNLLRAVLAKIEDEESLKRTAVIDANRSWSFEMLLATAKSIRDQMPAELPPNASVALLLEKDGVLVAAAIAVLLAGCAYIPIDAEKTPLARVHDILSAGGAVLVIAQKSLPAANIPVVVPGNLADVSNAASAPARWWRPRRGCKQRAWLTSYSLRAAPACPRAWSYRTRPHSPPCST